ncbi:MAG: nucleotidyltransferase family protein [bacterium]|nr:nucleotidyltransferase family protein [bacterium]
MSHPRIDLPQEQIADFCRSWKICELALFGSALRDDFSPDSDLDFLVAFAPEAEWSLLDHVQMEEELSVLLNRKVDLVSRRGIEQSDNWIRRRTILETAQVLYAA